MHLRKLSMLVLVVACVLGAAPAAHATAARALVDPNIAYEPADQQVEHMQDIATLGSKYLRLELSWQQGETAAGEYDEAYFANLDGLIDLAAANGVKVVLTIVAVPRWASNSAHWDDPPGTWPKGYQPFYEPKDSALDEFRAFCWYAADRFRGRVFAYECWNEPNLWLFLYPQMKSEAGDAAVETYMQLLRRCSGAVREADPTALVIGGVSAPVGFDDSWRTSPQTFARKLKAAGAGEYMDAYAHHPYVPGGTSDLRPEARPRDANHTVSISNIGALLDVFPGKSFYLTEFGYNTESSRMFGATPVSQATQADYLRRAYRLAGKHSQIKALFWYLRKDSSPSGKASDVNGVFTGLRTVTGARKKSWFTFAGGMRLTMSAPSSVRDGTYAKLTGTLTCSRLATETSSGGVGAKVLAVQRRSGGSWKTMKTVKTSGDGHYTTWLKMTSGGRVRLAFTGVVSSPSRFVAVR